MIVFTVRDTKCVVFQTVCDDDRARQFGAVLNASTTVQAFNAANLNSSEYSKFSSSLSMDCQDADTDLDTESSILAAIKRIDDRRINKYAGCYVESFVGGPGEYSPPECFCEKCIAAGRSYRYNSYGIASPADCIMPAGAKPYRWGSEFIEPGKRITKDNLGNLNIYSNEEMVKVGNYTFNHTTKDWSE